jgi:ribonuclease R
VNSSAGPKKSGKTKRVIPVQDERAALPSRDDLVAFIAREREAVASGHIPAKIGKREIARAFNIKGDDRIALKRMLRELEAEGAIERKRKILHRPGLLPAIVLADIFTRDRDGDLIATPNEWDKTQGEAPKIVINLPRKPKQGTPIPGLGDTALVRVELILEPEVQGPAYTGRIVKLLPRKPKTESLGIFRQNPDGNGGRVLPIDKKSVGRGELEVSEINRNEARDGDLVSVEILRTGRFGLPSAKVRDRLGAYDSEKAVSLIAIHAHNIPNVFQPQTLAEAEAAKPLIMEHCQASREDWRQLQLITIDPEDAKDHDDAVHAEMDPDQDNPGGYILTVAIADVAAYVKPHSALDREAQDRGNSVYFPDRVVPMLPERISNDLCSLKPLQDRPALAVRMHIAADGHKLKHSFHRIMMRSVAKLAYVQAQAAMDDAPDALTGPLLEPVLRPLYAAYAALKQARDKRCPLDLDLPERKILLNMEGTVETVVTPMRLDAHRLIEECMILANVAAAETLETKHQPLIYRAHDEPSIEKLTNLAEFLASLGIKLAKGQVLSAAQFNGILARVRGSENEHLVNEVVLRTQAQAEYVTENYGHFGLNLRRYAHFTSPIRRYADLIVHRGLIAALEFGGDGLPKMEPGELAEVAAKISATERRAMAAERETLERLIAAHLADQVGATFEARISGATRAGLFVRLAETGADGFIPAATLGTEYFRYDEALHALIGSRSGEMHRLGDIVSVKLIEVAPLAGALRFELLRRESGAIDKSKSFAVRRAKSRPMPKAARSPRSFGSKR